MGKDWVTQKALGPAMAAPSSAQQLWKNPHARTCAHDNSNPRQVPAQPLFLPAAAMRAAKPTGAARCLVDQCASSFAAGAVAESFLRSLCTLRLLRPKPEASPNLGLLLQGSQLACASHIRQLPNPLDRLINGKARAAPFRVSRMTE